MKVFPAVVLVLLAFSAFFMTVAVAPLVVLTIFYLVYALWTSRSSKAPPPPEAEPPPRRQSQPEAEADAPPPARRARITAVSHGSAAAAHETGAQDAPEPVGSGAGTTTLTQRTS